MYKSFLVMAIFLFLIACQTGEEQDINKLTAIEICKCSDPLFQFNLDVKKKLGEMGKEEKAKTFRKAESILKELEQCVLKSMTELDIELNSIQIDSVKSQLLGNCDDKPKQFLSNMYLDLKKVF